MIRAGQWVQESRGEAMVNALVDACVSEGRQGQGGEEQQDRPR